jgi:hypothetical protein
MFLYSLVNVLVQIANRVGLQQQQQQRQKAVRGLLCGSGLDGIWRFLRKTVFGTYEGASTIMHKAFNWKRSMLEVEAVPQELYSVSPDWFEYCFILVYEKFAACGEV